MLGQLILLAFFICWTRLTNSLRCGWPSDREKHPSSLGLHLHPTDRPLLRDERLARIGSWRSDTTLPARVYNHRHGRYAAPRLAIYSRPHKTHKKLMLCIARTIRRNRLIYIIHLPSPRARHRQARPRCFPRFSISTQLCPSVPATHLESCTGVSGNRRMPAMSRNSDRIMNIQESTAIVILRRLRLRVSLLCYLTLK